MIQQSPDTVFSIYPHYEKAGASKWEERGKFGNQGQGAPGLNPETRLASIFDPNVAAAVFQDMLKESGVTVITARLDLKNGVVMDGRRIQNLRLAVNRFEKHGQPLDRAAAWVEITGCAGVDSDLPAK